jgi:hypothetical protein
VQGVELEKVEFFCEALGSPQPTYTWLDKDGLDATQKLGKNTCIGGLLEDLQAKSSL